MIHFYQENEDDKPPRLKLMKNPNKPERQNTHLSLYYSSLPFLGLSSSSTACARSADGRATSGETDTTATDVAAAEHGCVTEHVGNDEEAHVGAADVDLVEMGDAAVAGGDGDVLELNVHVVLSCSVLIEILV
jgi:hypothetical protein